MPSGGSVPEEDAEGEVDIEAERLKVRRQIVDLEETLCAAPAAEFSGTSFLLQDLMADAEHAVRITALQWLVGKRDADVDAFVTALTDSNDLVQRVAIQLILDQGVSQEAVEDVITAAEDEDNNAVRQMLNARLMRQSRE